MMSNALIAAGVIKTEYYNEDEEEIQNNIINGNGNGIYDNQKHFLLLNRLKDENIFIPSDTFQHMGETTNKMLKTLKIKNPQFDYNLRYWEEGEDELDESLLNESPDGITIPDNEEEYLWYETPAMPFGYYNGKFYLGDNGSTHHQLPPSKQREYYEFPGRIFTKLKIISFWTYPDVKTFKDIINKISKNLHRNLWKDSEWKVEIIHKIESGKIEKKGNLENTSRGLWVKTANEKNYKSDFVSFEDYLGSEEMSKEDKAIRHLIPPGAGKKEVPYGYGSRNPKYQAKRQWQMATVGDESKEEPEGPKLLE